MESISDCLANNIKKLRQEHDLTQAEFAKKANISLAFLQGIESKRKWISPMTAQQIARAFEISEAKLFENCFEKNTPSKKSKRIRQAKLEHIPDDIFNALATTCRRRTWKWDTIRWIIQGYERSL